MSDHSVTLAELIAAARTPARSAAASWSRISASSGDKEALQHAVLSQAQQQLAALNLGPLHVVQTVIEKRATFVCTPQLQRPPQTIAPGLAAAGDYVQGPYPATLEGAVRSGWAAGLMP